jgi:hypothetical protein
MSKRFTYYGSKASKQYFLDLFPSDYYYSLDRGSVMSGNVVTVRDRELIGFTDYNLTAEEVTDGTMLSLLGSNNGFCRRLYSQGSKSRDITQTGAMMPFMANLGNPYLFNGKPFVFFDTASNRIMTSASGASILDKNSTLYLVYRSQSGLSSNAVFVEEVETANTQRVTIFSDTRATGFVHANYTPQTANNFNNYASQQPEEEIRVVALRKTGNLIESFDENGLVDDVTSSDTFGVNTRFLLGRQTTGNYFAGYFGTLVIREQSDDNTTLTNIINFLKTQYGI